MVKAVIFQMGYKGYSIANCNKKCPLAVTIFTLSYTLLRAMSMSV